MHETFPSRPGGPSPQGDDRSLVVLDGDGLLRFDGQWVAVPDGQLAVVELLVRRQGRLVRTQELLDAHRGAGGAPALWSLIHRVRVRVRRIGLTVHVVRGRGVVLEPSSDLDIA
jgi:hypothetical protein